MSGLPCRRSSTWSSAAPQSVDGRVWDKTGQAVHGPLPLPGGQARPGTLRPGGAVRAPRWRTGTPAADTLGRVSGGEPRTGLPATPHSPVTRRTGPGLH